MVTMMYRLPISGRDVSARADYMSFPDGYQVTEFAHEAMQWAVSEQNYAGNRRRVVSTEEIILFGQSALRLLQDIMMQKQFICP